MPAKILRPILLLSLLAAGLSGCRPEGAVSVLPDEIDFNFHIRPILSNHCFTCHGPDESSRQAGLRLDTYEGATALLETGNRAIDPRHWKKSAMIGRVQSEEPTHVMPPPETNNPLNERQIALLKNWIRQGAEWKQYWAFIPPDGEIYDNGLSIDHFIDKQMAMQGLEPAPEADRHSLVRRLSYLLTGLPPTPQQIEQYLADDSPEAYEQLADRLLASPRFGERWARHWMDLVRYAETKGHEFDYPVGSAWRYRDYLIRAFNSDLPYDQLIREHLAGDLLPEQRFDPETGINESRIATMFYSLGEGKHSPVDIREEEADRIDNIIDVTTKTFQGLTLACARCHDHKFDPLPTVDYYALYGIFESTRFTYYPTNSGITQMTRIDSLKAHKKAIRQLLAKAIPPDDQQGIALQTSQKLPPDEVTGEDIKILADFRKGDLQGWMPVGAAFSTGNALGEPVFDPSGKRLQSFSPARVSSRVLGTGIQGTLRSPTFIIETDHLTVRAAGAHSLVRVVIDNFQLIQDPIHGNLSQEVNHPEMKDHVFNFGMWKGSKAYLELMPGKMFKNGQRHDYSIEPDAWLEAEFAFFHNDPEPSELPAPSVDPAPLRSADLQKWVEGQASPETVARLNRKLAAGQVSASDPAITRHREAIRQLQDSLYAFTGYAGVSEGDSVFGSVFFRGNHLQPLEEKLPHRYLTVFARQFPPFPDQGSGRLDLANAIANPDNPLTARIMVNRIWHHLFGRGLVETVDNFGLQGKIPSHPALLDHLALRFIEKDWSVKAMIREIVLSEAFRRSTEASEAAQTKDPQNIWLQHFPIRRLEAEAIRDGILAVSGFLDTTRYGPPVPVYLTPFMQGRGRPRESGPMDGEGRRSIYQAVRRNFLSPMMLTFDQPVPFSTFGHRNVSNVPAQSLNLMNDPFVKEQAIHWAEHLLNSPGNFDDRLKLVYQTAFARLPNDSEREQAKAFFREQGQTMELSADQAAKEAVIWTDFCQVIYNSKEFIFLM